MRRTPSCQPCKIQPSSALSRSCTGRAISTSTTPGKSPGPSTYPATLDVFNGKTPLAWILSATFQNQQKGVFVDQKRCRHASTFVPLSHSGLPGPPDQLHAFTCLARGQLLIRARAVWNRRGFAASIAVRSHATRKPVAFGFINRTGFGGLYTSRGCVPHS